MMDRRLSPATDRVAHVSLRGQVEAPSWTEGVPARVTVPLTDLDRAPGGPRDRQLLFGADVTVIERRGDLAFVQAALDGYCGWVAAAALGERGAQITHRVSAAATQIYPAPDFKQRELANLSLGARLAVTGTEGRFARLATGGFVPLQHISDTAATDPAEVALCLIGTPYLWGGNSRAGIDCSGLVQAALSACASPCPGDSDLQQALGRPVEGSFRRNDLLFWPGHVAMALDADTMIHANANAMAVSTEPIAAAMARIERAGDGPFLGARRIIR